MRWSSSLCGPGSLQSALSFYIHLNIHKHNTHGNDIQVVDVSVAFDNIQIHLFVITDALDLFSSINM